MGFGAEAERPGKNHPNYNQRDSKIETPRTFGYFWSHEVLLVGESNTHGSVQLMLFL